MRVSHRWLASATLAVSLVGCGGEVAIGGLATPSGPQTTPPVSAGDAAASGVDGAVDGGAAVDDGAGNYLPTGGGFPASILSPAFLAVDDANIYWASYEVGPVGKVSIASGEVTELHATSATTIAIDATRVYTVSPSVTQSEPPSPVLACDKAGCGGNPTVIASDQTNVWGVAVDDANVYWTRQVLAAGVSKAPKTGGPTTVLVSGISATTISVSGGRVFFNGASSAAPPQLMMVSADGGAPVVLASANPNESVFGILADADNVYFATTDGVVAQVPAGGGAVTTLAMGQGRSIVAMATDGARVYWAAPELSLVASVPIAGGPMKTYPTSPAVDGLAVDSANVYWSDRGLNRVTKVAK